MKDRIVLIGAGGHARSCIDIIEAQGRYEIAGLVDVADKVGSSVLGYKVLGTDSDLEMLSKRYGSFFITVGQIGIGKLRAELFRKVAKPSVSMPVIIAPTAYVSNHASLGEGAIIMHGAVINAGARIGRNCIINTGAVVEHDVFVGDSTHISTLAVLNGGCTIGDLSFIGSNSTIREGIRVGAEVVVGAHSYVMKDCDSRGTYVGVPALKMEK